MSTMLDEFHRAFKLPRAPAPVLPDPTLAALRQQLLEEEVIELGEAVNRGKLDHIALELADVIYVAMGTAMTYGIDLEPVLGEVYAANMSKLGPDGEVPRRADGKVMKGDHYRAPNIAGALHTQGWHEVTSG